MSDLTGWCCVRQKDEDSPSFQSLWHIEATFLMFSCTVFTYVSFHHATQLCGQRDGLHVLQIWRWWTPVGVMAWKSGLRICQMENIFLLTIIQHGGMDHENNKRAPKELRYNWDVGLLLFILVYRTSTQNTIGMTPTSTMLIRDLCLPCDSLFGTPQPTH